MIFHLQFSNIFIFSGDVFLQVPDDSHDRLRPLFQLGTVRHQQSRNPSQVELEVGRRLNLVGYKAQQFIDVRLRQIPT